MGSLTERLVQTAAFALWEPAKAHLRRSCKRREVRPVVVRPGLAGAHIVAIIPVKDEALRMPALLRHYRQLGVEHFIVVDNESSDSLVADLESCEDVSIYRASGRYEAARYGIDWVNAVLSRRCRGKWVLLIDADEFLVFDSTHRDLPELCRWLEESGRRSLQALMVDMYSRRRASDNVVVAGQFPLEVCDLFDATGYERRYERPARTTWVKGGVRGRLFFPDRRWEGPALNKTPLVRWRWHYAFLRSAHVAWPRGVNGGFRTPELALLHFKFTSASAARMTDESHRASHTKEYTAYDGVQDISMVGAATDEYTRPSDLTRHGLLARTGPFS